MLKIPADKIHLKVNENPIDIVVDNAEIDDTHLDNARLVFDWNESTLRIPIDEFTVAVQGDTTGVHVKCHGVWERKLFGFIA